MPAGRLGTSFRLVMIVVLVGGFLVNRCMRPSGSVNCVVTESAADFTGQFLQHRAAKSNEIVPPAACEKIDRELDAGDGARAGRVRWMECLSGPDCDELGR